MKVKNSHSITHPSVADPELAYNRPLSHFSQFVQSAEDCIIEEHS